MKQHPVRVAVDTLPARFAASSHRVMETPEASEAPRPVAVVRVSVNALPGSATLVRFLVPPHPLLVVSASSCSTPVSASSSLFPAALSKTAGLVSSCSLANRKMAASKPLLMSAISSLGVCASQKFPLRPTAKSSASRHFSRHSFSNWSCERLAPPRYPRMPSSASRAAVTYLICCSPHLEADMPIPPVPQA
jgi:hypothetical protein